MGAQADDIHELKLDLFNQNFEIINEKFMSYKMVVDQLYGKVEDLSQVMIDMYDELSMGHKAPEQPHHYQSGLKPVLSNKQTISMKEVH